MRLTPLLSTARSGPIEFPQNLRANAQSKSALAIALPTSKRSVLVLCAGAGNFKLTSARRVGLRLKQIVDNLAWDVFVGAHATQYNL
jgi:hypothetical protein